MEFFLFKGLNYLSIMVADLKKMLCEITMGSFMTETLRHPTEGLIKPHRFKDDFTLFICDRCKRQCALLTKERHKPTYCPFLMFEVDNSSHIFKF